ncbi:MAG: hypothetical protein AAFV07_04630 [Bacteroidota bacterium]
MATNTQHQAIIQVSEKQMGKLCLRQINISAVRAKFTLANDFFSQLNDSTGLLKHLFLFGLFSFSRYVKQKKLAHSFRNE